jgi:AcrR family transcriptional regulator
LYLQPATHQEATVTAAEPIAERSPGGRAQATHAALVELAADLFAEQGYAETSMRDFARRSPVSLGAVYLHFKNKAELLVEAIHRRIDDDLESDNPAGAGPVDPVHRLHDIALRYPQRRRLRALLVQAAAAAQTDDDARARVRAAQLEHVEGWVHRYEANRERIGIDPDIDLETAVLFTWAIELGLGMLEAFDMAPASPERWAEIQRRAAHALLLPDPASPSVEHDAPARRRP